jgi:ATP-grasp domain
MAISSLQELRHYFADKSVYWYGRSHFLYRGMERYADRFFFVPTTDHGRFLSRQIGVPVATLRDLQRDPRATKCVLAFDADDELAKRAKSARAVVCVPRAAASRRLGSKFSFPQILRESGAEVPWHVMISRPTVREVVAALRRAPGGVVVAQTEANNLTGRGTFLLRTKEDVEELVRRRLPSIKVTEFVEGLPLTVSGCVSAEVVHVSCISRQLVGVPELTSCWAAHCGNQPVSDQAVPVPVLKRIQQFGLRVGRTLMKRGLVGQFGVDLILARGGRIIGLELNPRIQSVSSLVHATEIKKKRVPLQAMQVLAFLNQPLDQSPVSPFLTTLHSQMILEHLGDPALTKSSLRPGAYSFDEGNLRLVDVTADLVTLKRGHWLITPQVVQGDALEPGTKMCIVQRHGFLVNEEGQLKSDAKKLVRLLRKKLVGAR